MTEDTENSQIELAAATKIEGAHISIPLEQAFHYQHAMLREEIMSRVWRRLMIAGVGIVVLVVSIVGYYGASLSYRMRWFEKAAYELEDVSENATRVAYETRQMVDTVDAQSARLSQSIDVLQTQETDIMRLSKSVDQLMMQIEEQHKRIAALESITPPSNEGGGGDE
jgi:Na+-transporting methylmalonyl-CoA/oxaloacetate decarboxylase gamma subunit